MPHLVEGQGIGMAQLRAVPSDQLFSLTLGISISVSLTPGLPKPDRQTQILQAQRKTIRESVSLTVGDGDCPCRPSGLLMMA